MEKPGTAPWDVAETGLPPCLAALRHRLVALEAIDGEDYAAALAELSAAEEEAPGVPATDYLLAVVLAEEGSPGEALDRARRFLAVAGQDDPAGRLAEARALLLLSRAGEAAEAARAGLAVLPDSPGLLAALGRALPAGNKGELADRFARAAAPRDVIGPLADALLDAGDREATAVLIAKHRELDSEDPISDWWESKLLVLAGRYDEAAAMLARGRAASPEDEREVWADAYADAMLRAGKAAAAYLPGSPTAFERVARKLRDDGDGAALAKLVEAHRPHDRDGLGVLYYDAEARSLLGDWVEADRLFAEGARRVGDDDAREDFRYSRAANLYAAGEWREAYEKVGPARATFLDLAIWLADDALLEDLVDLLKRHRAADSEDPALLLFLAETCFMKGESGQAVEVLERSRERLAELIDEDWAVAWRFRDRLVRSLLRLGRTTPAMEEARRSTAEDGDPFYEALCLAVMERPEELLPMLEVLVRHGYEPAQFYEDEFLGHALRTPKFAAVRARFPD